MKSLLCKKTFTTCVFSIFIVFISAQNFKWVESVGGSGTDRLNDLRTDISGNPVSVGYFSGNFILGSDTLISAGNKDILIVKYNKWGNVVWSRNFGSSAEDVATSVVVDALNNIYVGGYFSGTLTADTFSLVSNGAKDAFLIKLNPAGIVTMAISYGSTSDDFCNDIAITSNGEIISGGSYAAAFSFGGQSLGNAGSNDVYFLKLDSMFNVMWLKGNGASLNDACRALCVDQNGNIFAVGVYKGQVFPPIQVPFPINCASGNNLTGGIGGAEDLWVAKLNGQSGCYDWVKTIYGGSVEDISGIACDPSGQNCYAVGGFGTNAFFDGTQYNTNGSFDGFLCKFNGSNGSIQVVKAFGGTGNDATKSIHFTNVGLLITGIFDGTASFGNGISVSSAGGQDIFVGVFDLNGNCQWAKSCGGALNDEATVVSLYGDKHIYFCGQYLSSAATFGTLSPISNPGAATGFVCRVDLLPTTPSICMVTVDSTSTNNVIYWDKTPSTNGDVFKIYRDVGNNTYMPLVTIPFDSLSEFTDTLRSLYAANGDPNVSSWRYKLSVTDSFNNESLKSPYHQTIFFQNNLANFSWNHYSIEGQTTPVPALQNYEFLRDDLTNGNWAVIQTLSASSTAYTDPNYATFQSTGSWRVLTTWTISCDPTRTLINTSRSNVKGIAFGAIGFEELSNGNFMRIFPNPVSENVIVAFNPSFGDAREIELLDIRGLVIRRYNLNAEKGTLFHFSISDLSDGVYFLRLNNGKVNFTQRLMKQ